MLPRSKAAGLGARSLLGLPPQLRTAVYHKRSFITTVTPSFDAHLWLDAAITVPHYMLQTLHGFGLPWFAAIPLAAAILRGLIILPFIQLPARKAQQRYLALMPIRQFYRNAAKRTTHKVRFHVGPEQAKLAEKNATRAFEARLHERWNTRLFMRMLPFTSLPIFLTMAETIRRMVGARTGLLGLVADSVSPLRETATTENDTLAALGESVDGVADAGLSTAAPFLEPSLATEGALWFPDLMVPDPHFTLPYAVSALTMITISRGSRLGLGQEEKFAGRTLRRILLTGGLAIGPLTLHVPSAILVYWMSSTACGYASHMFLDKFYPLKSPPRACKRAPSPMAASEIAKGHASRR